MPIEETVVSASRVIAAPAATVFELIADPAQQPRWDGNDNLADAAQGQRVRAVGDVFTMTLTNGAVPPGHLWRWSLEPLDEGRTRVTHTYDWTSLTDEQRLVRARATTSDWLAASLERLAALAET